MNELAIIGQPMELYRQSTDIASICKEMAVRCAVEIQGRRYIPVEVWQAIATAHSCVASSKDVQWVDKTEHSAGGFRAIGEIRRMSDGAIISAAEGFVGDDETTWFGGEVEKDEWVNKRKTGNKIKVTLPKRPDYAIRAMCQTRAMSRAGRSAFAHVVVLMNAGLDTAPAEEAEADNIDYGSGHHRAPVQPRGEGDEIPMKHTTDPAPEIYSTNWRDLLNAAADPLGRYYKPVGQLSTVYLKWFREDPKGVYANWKARPQDEIPGLRSAIEFAWAAKLQKTEQPAGETPAAKKEPTPATGSVQMMEKMIEKMGVNRDAFIETAIELEFLDNAMDDITDAHAERIMANFDNLKETTEAK